MKTLKFTAKVLPSGDGAYIAIDDATREALGGGGRIPVRATFNGAQYRGTICKMGGLSGLGVTRAIRAAIGVEPGDRVRVTLERDDAPRTVDVPPDLAAALRKNRGARAVFERLSYTHRKEYVRWIESAKRIQTRETRIVKVTEMLIERTDLKLNQ